MTFEWHPREHRAALDGMLMLTLEERGAYNTLLDLIYDRGAPIPDDPRWLAGWMQCSTRRWAVLRASLIAKGKIQALEIDGQAVLMNERAAFEIENQAKLSRNNSESGAKGGRKRAENEARNKENNSLGQAPAQATLKLKTKTLTEEGSVSAPNGTDTGGEPPDVPFDRNAEAWREAVPLLCPGDGRHGEARKLFGRILKIAGCKAGDLLPAIYEAQTNGTEDAPSYLMAVAKRMGARRKTGQPLPIREQAHWC